MSEAPQGRSRQPGEPPTPQHRRPQATIYRLRDKWLTEQSCWQGAALPGLFTYSTVLPLLGLLGLISAPAGLLSLDDPGPAFRGHAPLVPPGLAPAVRRTGAGMEAIGNAVERQQVLAHAG